MKKMGLFLLLAALFLAGIRAASESAAFPAVSRPTASRSRSQSDDSFLILVNRDNPLPEDYAPQLTWLSNGLNRVRADIYEDLSAMLTAGTEEGLRFVVASAYRDREYQQGLLEEDMAILASAGYSRDEAYREATRTTMPPGCSEHETGLALDIVSLDNQRLEEAQEETPENIWLRENCWKYGFILRYPRGKEEITGIGYRAVALPLCGPRGSGGDHAPGPHAGGISGAVGRSLSCQSSGSALRQCARRSIPAGTRPGK